jgi:A/G-specific adenine glycosylase
MICPWAKACRARAEGLAETLPRKAPKAEQPQRYGAAFWMVRADGAVYLRRREAKGLLGGMMEVPSTDWRAKTWSEAGAITDAPVKAKWRALEGEVRHTFTHFRLTLTVLTANINARDAQRLGKTGVWVPLDRLADAGLPSVMAKIAKHALRKIE